MTIESVEIFGSSGYLGSYVSSKFPNWHLSYRQDVPSREYSLDFSFPRDYFDDQVFMDFKMLILNRVQSCNLQGLNYIYFGSISSIPPIVSTYGQRKMEIESLVVQNGQTVINLGLVVSDLNPGGRYQTLRRTLQKLPFILSPNENTFELYCHELERLSDIDSFILNIQGGRKYLYDNLIRTNLGTVSSRIAKELGIREIRLGKASSRALEVFIANFSISSLDPLKSLTVKRKLDGLN